MSFTSNLTSPHSNNSYKKKKKTQFSEIFWSDRESYTSPEVATRPGRSREAMQHVAVAL